MTLVIMKVSIETLSIMKLCIDYTQCKCHLAQTLTVDVTQYNDTQHNDSQHNNTQHLLLST
jgi:hypothetical protein